MEKTIEWKVGPQLGEHLLEIAQGMISDGNPDAAMELYKTAVIGITDEYIMTILKNEMVLTVDENGKEFNLVDYQDEIDRNARNMTDWNYVTGKLAREIRESIKKVADARMEASPICNMRLDYRFEDDSYSGICNCVANAIINGYSSIHVAQRHIIDSLVVQGRSNTLEVGPRKDAYSIYTYFKEVEKLGKLYRKYDRMMNFLTANSMAEHPANYELFMNGAFFRLTEFVKDALMFSIVPDFNEKFAKIKEELEKMLLSCDRYDEYQKWGMVPCSMDVFWDAGWLSPEGLFFALNGAQSMMLHQSIADNISNGTWFKENAKLDKDDTPESWLELHGWMKNFRKDFYGHFVRSKELIEQGYAFCPTDIQVKKLCDYVDKYYNGTFYTQPNSLVGYRDDSEEKTSRVRQMDSFALNKTFASIRCII